MLEEEIENAALATLNKRRQKIKPIKPVMSGDVDSEVHSVLARFNHAKKWSDWGLSNLRDMGTAILLYGPPGTGKTTIAEYMSKIVGRGKISISMADFGSQKPGENEKGIRNLFEKAKLGGNMTVFIDECEAILWDRGRSDGSSSWMIPVIDELLVQIAKHKGLCVLATNLEKMLDSALDRRLMAKIHVGPPEQPQRVALWKMKLPKKFPFQPTMSQFSKLAEFSLTGAQIETAILKAGGLAIAENRLPIFQDFCNVATQLTNTQ